MIFIKDMPQDLLKIMMKYTLKFSATKKANKSGICSELINKKTPLFSSELCHSSERKKAQQELSQFFTKETQKNKKNYTADALNHADNLSYVLDEFLMNAIWDANPKRCKQNRAVPVKLTAKEKVRILALTWRGGFVLSITDQFGLFQPTTADNLLRYVISDRNTIDINNETKNSGAGLGLFMVLQKIDCLVIEVHKKVSTQVTAIVYGDKNPKNLREKKCSIIFLNR